ncbi:MAG: glycosyltransferase family 2 protein [Rhodospirillales bacterium]|nr:glycosyltransferase family 2 protein [Rhodospirillales bacterium]
MTYVIIQIPCYNEEQTIGITLSQLPKSLPGIDRLEWLIIDDGCQDNTVNVARAHGVHHVVRHTTNKGLAAAFSSGLKRGLELGADILINTDADNQYVADDIAKLIEPLLDGRADMAVGVRAIAQIGHFSPLKKWLQRLGSWVVRHLSKADVSDAPSGFRAITRDAAKRLFVYNRHTYTIETLIQSGQQNIKTISIPIRTNNNLRPSRLIKSTIRYVFVSIVTMFRIYVIYNPIKFFFFISFVFFIPGIFLFLRFLFFYVSGAGAGYIQSLVIGAVFLMTSAVLVVAGVLADLVAVNRRHLEEIRLLMFDVRERVSALGSEGLQPKRSFIDRDAANEIIEDPRG